MIVLSAIALTTLLPAINALIPPHHLVARAANADPYADANGQTVTFENCYRDNPSSRVLSGSGGPTAPIGSAMTPQGCALACAEQNYKISGTEFGGECYCGTTLPSSSLIIAGSNCNSLCNGDSNFFCGGENALSIYSQTLLSEQANNAASDSTVTYLGCGTVAGGAVPTTAYSSGGDATVDKCAALALTGGYKGFGLKGEACVVYRNAPVVDTPSPTCTDLCAGNNLKLCGSSTASVYQLYTIATTRVPADTVDTTLTLDLGTTFVYQGCYPDTSGTRFLANGKNINQNTPLACATACYADGYEYAGVEYGIECWCTHTLNPAISVIPTVSGIQPGCTRPCSGNSAVACGGGNAIAVWHLDNVGGFGVSATNYKGEDITLFGCYQDNSLNSPANRIFPVQIKSIAANAMTHDLCVEACSAKITLSSGVPIHYTYSGLQYGSECWCSDSAPLLQIPNTRCSVKPCGGDANTWCGAGNAMLVYQHSISTPKVVNSFPGATYSGCFATGGGTPAQYTLYSSGSNSITVELCVEGCTKLGFAYAGLEGASAAGTCKCSQTMTQATTSANCNVACAGAANEICGGSDATSVYATSSTALVIDGGSGATFTTTLTSASRYLGCYVDSINLRLLGRRVTILSNQVTPSKCIDACTAIGLNIAGVEYSTECWCSSVAPATWTGDPTDIRFGKPGECNMGCGGASNIACGGPNRISVYSNGGQAPVISALASVTVAPGQTYTYQYCGTDNWQTTRTLKNAVKVASNSPLACATECYNRAYKYAGVEYGTECYCANTYTGTTADPLGCDMKCPGNAAAFCGGSNRLTLYLNADMDPVNIAPYTNSGGVWTYQACWREPTGGRVYTTQINNSVGNTIQSCLDLGAQRGFNTCGLQYGGECWCGNALPTTGTQVSEAYCSEYTDGNGDVVRLGKVCSGNTLQWCGAGYTFSLYSKLSGGYTPITTSPS